MFALILHTLGNKFYGLGTDFFKIIIYVLIYSLSVDKRL